MAGVKPRIKPENIGRPIKSLNAICKMAQRHKSLVKIECLHLKSGVKDFSYRMPAAWFLNYPAWLLNLALKAGRIRVYKPNNKRK
jgi:hypothetical protein